MIFFEDSLGLLGEIPPVDGSGVCGGYLHYALVIAFVGSAFLIFLYLWRKGRLDMDEEPKIKMMEDDDKPERGNDERRR
jgi:hypothetical protein